MISHREEAGGEEKVSVKEISCVRYQDLFSYPAGKRHTADEAAEMKKHLDDCTECVKPVEEMVA